MWFVLWGSRANKEKERRLIELRGLRLKIPLDAELGCCLWCGNPLEYNGRGRKPKYCSRSCRQRAYECRVSGNIGLFEHLKQFHTCYLCGKPLDWSDPLGVCVDHVIPTIRGGMTIPENLRPVHVECNAIKGEKLLDPAAFGLK